MHAEAITLFRQLADRSPAEREEYYARQRVPEAVRDEVESLLLFDGSTSDSFGTYIASPPEQAPTPGNQTMVSTASSATAPRPAAIGRYEIVRLLGRGGMGEVYLARDPVLDRDIALKLIGSDLDDDAVRKRLAQEARAAGRLRHPNIVTTFDAGQHEGRAYIAMEYVPGETLRSLIRRQAALPLRRRLELIEDACAGLAHAHHAGVIHLDIKPDNLMLDETGIVKVLDFGIARVVKSQTLVTNHLVGTLRYMSPEQISGRPLDRRSDVFSLGCAFYELVTYTPAYAGSFSEIVTRIAAGPIPSLLAVVPEIDPRLDAVIRRAMAIDPSDRYDDLDDLRAELARIRGEIAPFDDLKPAQPTPVVSGGPPATPLPAIDAGSHRSQKAQSAPLSRRFRVTASIGVLAVLTAGAGAFLLFEARTPTRTPDASSQPAFTPAPSTAAPSETTAPDARAPNEEVWRRLALGDRDGVLQLLRSPSPGRGTGPDLRLASDVFNALRASVAQARQVANSTSGAAASEAYRAAEARLTRATRLQADNQPLEALGALWQAADFYAQSLAAGGPPPPRAAVERQAPIPTEAAPRSSGVNQPGPPPAIESGRLEPLLPPAVETTSPARAASAVPDPPKGPSDEEAILDALSRYHGAYQALDVAGVLRMFPSLGREQVEQLRRTFDGMTAYGIEVRDPRVDVQNDSAIVRAVVARHMVPRVGRPVANEVETEFHLRRDGIAWVITAVTTP